MSAPARSLEITSGDDLRTALCEQIESQSLDLPLMPRVAQQVVQKTQDSRSGIADLAKLIESDPALCAHILRIANSPLYAANVKLVSVRQALSRLGTELLSQIALSVAMKSGVFNNRRFMNQLSEIWKLGLVRSYFSREIARIRRDNVEQAFLSALMLEIGKPVMFHAVAELVDNDIVKLDEITATVDALQARAGSMVARAWELPEIVEVCISACNPDCKEIPSQFQVSVATVQLSSLFAIHMLAPCAEQQEAIQSHSTLEILNLYPENVTDLFDSTENATKLVEAFT